MPANDLGTTLSYINRTMNDFKKEDVLKGNDAIKGRILTFGETLKNLGYDLRHYPEGFMDMRRDQEKKIDEIISERDKFDNLQKELKKLKADIATVKKELNKPNEDKETEEQYVLTVLSNDIQKLIDYNNERRMKFVDDSMLENTYKEIDVMEEEVDNLQKESELEINDALDENESTKGYKIHKIEKDNEGNFVCTFEDSNNNKIKANPEMSAVISDSLKFDYYHATNMKKTFSPDRPKEANLALFTNYISENYNSLSNTFLNKICDGLTALKNAFSKFIGAESEANQTSELIVNNINNINRFQKNDTRDQDHMSRPTPTQK